jgi:hypothetical protein
MTRTQDDLNQASEHLHYEWDMRKSVAQAMVMNFAGAGVLNNAMFESFAVHVRSLIFFLSQKTQRPMTSWQLTLYRIRPHLRQHAVLNQRTEKRPKRGQVKKWHT